MVAELTEAVRDTIRSAARQLTGYRRRRFQAEVAMRYCRGSARQAESDLGWRRDTVHTGLNELRTGLRCVDAFTARGRHKCEEDEPELARAIHALVAPESQADPKFQTPLAYTRLTAKAVREQLGAAWKGTGRTVPAERTLHDILNRLGYRLRRVRKTKPKKRFARRTPSSSTCGGSTPPLRATPTPSASRWTPRPR